MTMNADKQRALQDFINREVISSLSSAVYQLQQQLKEDAPLREQIMELSSKQDYLSPLEEKGWEWTDDGSLVHKADGYYWEGDYICDFADMPFHVFDEDEMGEAEKSLCEELGLEPYENEVFEYWAVSEWLGEKLKAQGELIDDDFLGLCVWGRTTTGQSISMDGVIETIYDIAHQ